MASVLARIAAKNRGRLRTAAETFQAAMRSPIPAVSCVKRTRSASVNGAPLSSLADDQPFATSRSTRPYPLLSRVRTKS